MYANLGLARYMGSIHEKGKRKQYVTISSLQYRIIS